VSSTRRMPTAPEIAPLAEAGVPGFDFVSWQMIVAPAGTPRDIVDKLNAGLVSVIHDRQFQDKRMLPQGLDPAGSSAAAFSDLIREDAKRWARVVELTDIKPE
jgi:tripartite-type tricarboxylate transporter receptor subunit TctC